MGIVGGRGLHGQVVHELGARIMRGGLPPGATIDPELIAHEFDVSRTVVREALRVLTAKGLVGARPRFGTFVTERSCWQLLDIDVMTWRAGDDPDLRLVTELDEVRLVIEPASARIAAQRRTGDELERIRQAWFLLDQSYRGEHESYRDDVDADLEFHRAVLAASGNELLERFQAVIEPALRARDWLTDQHMIRSDFLGSHHGVYQAIADGNPDQAYAKMCVLMEPPA